MNDIDFDELDRNINSLNAGMPSDASSGLNNSTVSNPIPQRPTTSINPTAPPLAGRRSTGQFMDVVHPSSNMRPSMPVPERPSVVNVSPVTAPIVDNATTQAKSNWPDPIDFNKSDNNNMPTGARDEDDDINRISDEINNSLNQTSVDSLDSPFISGTKVEKRPLGAFSNDVPSDEAVVPEFKPYQPMSNAGPQLSNTESPLPAELDDNLLSIEAGDEVDNSAAVEEPIPVMPTPRSITTPEVPEAPVVAPVPDVMNANQPVVSASIPQQYQEKPSTGDQTSGAIYDPNTYNKALLKQPKSKSGWLWVLWILVLLIVGAGAGAAVYFWVLPLF